MIEADDSIQIPLPPPPVRITDPHVLKARMLEDYTSKAGTFGLPSDPLALERLVLLDLTLADNFTREEGPPVLGPAPTEDDRAKKRAAAQAQLAEDSDGTSKILAAQDHPREWGPTLNLPPSVGLSERWMLAKGRLDRIMDGAGEIRRYPDGSYDFRAMTATCGVPGLAYEFLALWFSFDLRDAVQTRRHNPFWDMSHRDASLKFVRLVEDICDRSSGTSMGPWFVPK